MGGKAVFQNKQGQYEIRKGITVFYGTIFNKGPLSPFFSPLKKPHSMCFKKELCPETLLPNHFCMNVGD
jgi:hypothetical protein